MSDLKKLYVEKLKKQMLEKYKYTNPCLVPALEKIVLHRGLGEAVSNSKVVDISLAQFQKITGQKPIVSRAKKSISNFKLREGQIIGCKVTMRSDKMFDFLTKLLRVCLPRIRDFRGLSRAGFDGRGNYTLGLKDDSIFPEVDFESIDRSRGMDITFVTSASTDPEAETLLELFGMPFTRRQEVIEKE